MSRHGLSMLAAAACFLFGNQALLGASAKDLMKALDLDGIPGIELVRQEFIKYKYDESGWIETDENGDNVIASRSTTSKWDVQKGNWGRQGLYPGVSPLMGGSCVRSGIDTACKEANDAQSARLIFKVSSGGILRYSCLTACASSDGVNVYVDGEFKNGHFDSFGPTNFWGKDPDNPDTEEGNYEVEITGGLAPEGSAYAGTYDHEVIFEFYKSEPNFEWDDVKEKYYYQSNDEPQKPDKEDYTWDGDFDKEGYEIALAEEYYSFRNSIWLDKFQWIPLTLEIAIGFGDVTQPLELVDRDGVLLSNNALEYGYSIRYTLDGTEPTVASPLYSQSADDEQAVNIDHSCTLKAMVFDRDNRPVKQTLVSRQIVVKGSKPVLTVERISDDEALVSMSSADAANEVRYTLNGSMPSRTSARYASTLSIKDPLTVKAISVRAGIEPGEVAELVIEQAVKPSNLTVKDGAFEEPSHIYTGDGGLEVFCDTVPGTELLCSVDGEPWKVCARPVTVKAKPGRTSATVAFRTREAGKLASDSIQTVVYKATEKWTVNGEAGTSNALSLDEGWTLIGLPVSMTTSQESYLLNRFRFFGFNAEGGHYELATSLEEGRSYWVFKTPATDFQVMLTGIQKGGKALGDLPPGWHGYAPDDMGEVPAGIIAWQYVNGHYEPATKFVRGKGYFIYKAE